MTIVKKTILERVDNHLDVVLYLADYEQFSTALNSLKREALDLGNSSLNLPRLQQWAEKARQVNETLFRKLGSSFMLVSTPEDVSFNEGTSFQYYPSAKDLQPLIRIIRTAKRKMSMTNYNAMFKDLAKYASAYEVTNDTDTARLKYEPVTLATVDHILCMDDYLVLKTFDRVSQIKKHSLNSSAEDGIYVVHPSAAECMARVQAKADMLGVTDKTVGEILDVISANETHFNNEARLAAKHLKTIPYDKTSEGAEKSMRNSLYLRILGTLYRADFPDVDLQKFADLTLNLPALESCSLETLRPVITSLRTDYE